MSDSGRDRGAVDEMRRSYYRRLSGADLSVELEYLEREIADLRQPSDRATPEQVEPILLLYDRDLAALGDEVDRRRALNSLVHHYAAQRVSAEFARELKERVDFAEFLVHHFGVRLKREGRTYVALCPFHTERTPSFTVWVDESRAHCFGCGWDGDVYDFMRDYGRAGGWVQAVEQLAQYLGVALPPRLTVRPDGAPPARRRPGVVRV